MKYLHTMVRVTDLDVSLDFYCNKLGLVETRRIENEKGRFTLVFLAAPPRPEAGRRRESPLLELTYNWDPEDYKGGRNFGHLAYRVDNIYETCAKLQAAGVIINRPPRDGYMAFIRSPDNISVELLEAGLTVGSARTMGQHAERWRMVIKKPRFRGVDFIVRFAFSASRCCTPLHILAFLGSPVRIIAHVLVLGRVVHGHFFYIHWKASFIFTHQQEAKAIVPFKKCHSMTGVFCAFSILPIRLYVFARLLPADFGLKEAINHPDFGQIVVIEKFHECRFRGRPQIRI